MEDKGSGDLEKIISLSIFNKKGLICNVLKSQPKTEQATLKYQWLPLH